MIAGNTDGIPGTYMWPWGQIQVTYISGGFLHSLLGLVRALHLTSCKHRSAIHNILARRRTRLLVVPLVPLTLCRSPYPVYWQQEDFFVQGPSCQYVVLSTIRIPSQPLYIIIHTFNIRALDTATANMCQLCAIKTVSDGARWPNCVLEYKKDLDSVIPMAHDEYSKMLENEDKSLRNKPNESLIAMVADIVENIQKMEADEKTWWLSDKKKQERQFMARTGDDEKLTRQHVVHAMTIEMIEEMKLKVGGFVKWCMGFGNSEDLLEAATATRAAKAEAREKADEEERARMTEKERQEKEAAMEEQKRLIEKIRKEKQERLVESARVAEQARLEKQAAQDERARLDAQAQADDDETEDDETAKPTRMSSVAALWDIAKDRKARMDSEIKAKEKARRAERIAKNKADEQAKIDADKAKAEEKIRAFEQAKSDRRAKEEAADANRASSSGGLAGLWEAAKANKNKADQERKQKDQLEAQEKQWLAEKAKTEKKEKKRLRSKADMKALQESVSSLSVKQKEDDAKKDEESVSKDEESVKQEEPSQKNGESANRDEEVD